MKWKLASLVLVLAVLGALVVAPLTAKAQDTLTIDPIPVTASKNNGNKKFTGQWEFTKFVAQDDAVFAEGVLTGKVTNKHDKETNTVEETVLLPVSVKHATTGSAGAVRAQAGGVCDVLELVLGPITLNLLGLNLFIGGAGNVPILIDLDATPSEGLLGQILCGLAGGVPLLDLLDQLNAALDDLIQALNELFGLFG